MATKRLEVQITGNARGAQQAFSDVERSAGGMQTKLAGIARGVGVAVAAGTAALAVGAGAMLSSAYSAALESQKIARETARVIQTTGGAANVTAAQVGDLAESVSRLTGVDDELIQQGANLLLTFTNVRNEVGKGNDVFDQATSLALDMSAVLGTDMQSAAMQVGKALNDPIKGITALTRAGVSFTAEQKAQIKAMAESGDMLGAQKIILAELSREFAGGAAAAAGPLDRLKVTLGNIQEELGARLIPVVASAADWIAGTFIPAVTAAGKQLAAGFQGASDGGLFGEAGAKARAGYDFIVNEAMPAISDAFERVRGVVESLNLAELGGVLRSAVEPIIDAVRSFDLGAYFEALSNAFSGLVDVGREVYQIIVDLEPVWKVLGTAIGAVAFVMHKVFIAQLNALGWVLSNVIAPILRGVSWWIQNVMIPVWSTVGRVAGAAFGWIADRARDWWAVVGPLLRAAWGWVQEHILPAFRRFASTAAEVFESVRATVKEKVDLVVGIVTGVASRVEGIRDRLTEALTAPFRAAFEAVAWLWNNTLGKISINVPDLPGLPGRGESFSFGTIDTNVGAPPRTDAGPLGTLGYQAERPRSGRKFGDVHFHNVTPRQGFRELAFQERRGY